MVKSVVDMKNKKKLWWLALPIGIAALWFWANRFFYMAF